MYTPLKARVLATDPTDTEAVIRILADITNMLNAKSTNPDIILLHRITNFTREVVSVHNEEL